MRRYWRIWLAVAGAVLIACSLVLTNLTGASLAPSPQPASLSPEEWGTVTAVSPWCLTGESEYVALAEWPESMRVGDVEVVRVSLIPRPVGSLGLAPELPSHQVEPTGLVLPASPPGCAVYVIASLSMVGLHVELADPGQQSFVPGAPNTWRWTIRPEDPGMYRSALSLVLRWEPTWGPDVTGPRDQVVWGRVLTIRAHNVLGLSGRQADWARVIGSTVGILASFPFLDKTLEALWRRVRQSRFKGR